MLASVKLTYMTMFAMANELVEKIKLLFFFLFGIIFSIMLQLYNDVSEEIIE